MAIPKQFQSVRWRLMLTYVLLIVIGFGALAVWAGQQISASVTQDSTRHLEVEALLLAKALHEPLEDFLEGESNAEILKQRLDELNQKSSAYTTLITKEGLAWLDSTNTLPNTDLSQDPEIASAMSNNVTHHLRNNEEGLPTLYSAAPVTDDDQIMALVRVSIPASEIQAEIYTRWAILGAGVAIMTIVALLVSVWLSSSLTKPILQLSQSALKLADGDLSQRFDTNRADEIGELALSFNYMAQEVQSMLDEQRAFASNASHELRTPLTTIRLRTELLCSGELDEATTQRYLVDIDQEINRLNGLVEDLIWLSRFEANRVKRGQEQIDPIRLAKSMHRELEPKASNREISFSLITPELLPSIEANRNHLHVVFRNLVDNAIKYTPDSGQVRWELQQKNNQLQAIISDTGRGIAPEELPHIGKRFYRTDKARSRAVGGIGLGLSLVRLIVEFYGGQLDINSAGLGKGTTVKVLWPLDVASR